MARAGVYRDYVSGAQSWIMASVGSKTAAIGAGGVPILTYAVWLDVGTANGVLSEFTSLPSTQEDWIGPWSHGQGYFADPFKPSQGSLLTPAEHQQLADRLYAFFDRYMKHDERPGGSRLLHYYTLNARTWHTTTRFPVPGTHTVRLYLAAGHALTRRPATRSRRLAGLGPAAPRPDGRHRLAEPLVHQPHRQPGRLPNRAAVDRKLLSYTSAPLRRATIVTGLGRVTLTVTGLRGASHGALYAYLEDVQPSGRVTYVTEGELALADRAIAPMRDNPPWCKLRTPRTYERASAAPFPLHKPQQVRFDLLPTSVLFGAGDRIRITIAAADPTPSSCCPPTAKPPTGSGTVAWSPHTWNCPWPGSAARSRHGRCAAQPGLSARSSAPQCVNRTSGSRGSA